MFSRLAGGIFRLRSAVAPGIAATYCVSCSQGVGTSLVDRERLGCGGVASCSFVHSLPLFSLSLSHPRHLNHLQTLLICVCSIQPLGYQCSHSNDNAHLESPTGTSHHKYTTVLQSPFVASRGNTIQNLLSVASLC